MDFLVFLVLVLFVTFLVLLFWPRNTNTDINVSIDYAGPIPPKFTSKVFRVIDGDTVKIFYNNKWVTVRLHGIDAPESKQKVRVKGIIGAVLPTIDGGKVSADTLRNIVYGKPLTCVKVTMDKYGRTVGVLSVPDVPDVNREMVRRGWAMAYIQYGGEQYAADEDTAKKALSGIWKHDFTVPSQWRKGVRS